MTGMAGVLALSAVIDLTATIGGRKKAGGGEEIPVVQPHDHAHVLGTLGAFGGTRPRAIVARDTSVMNPPGLFRLPGLAS